MLVLSNLCKRPADLYRGTSDFQSKSGHTFGGAAYAESKTLLNKPPLQFVHLLQIWKYVQACGKGALAMASNVDANDTRQLREKSRKQHKRKANEEEEQEQEQEQEQEDDDDKSHQTQK